MTVPSIVIRYIASREQAAIARLRTISRLRTCSPVFRTKACIRYAHATLGRTCQLAPTNSTVHLRIWPVIEPSFAADQRQSSTR